MHEKDVARFEKKCNSRKQSKTQDNAGVDAINETPVLSMKRRHWQQFIHTNLHTAPSHLGDYGIYSEPSARVSRRVSCKNMNTPHFPRNLDFQYSSEPATAAINAKPYPWAFARKVLLRASP